MRISNPVSLGKVVVLAFVVVFSTISARAGEGQIEGKWKTNQGNTASISKCGISYCIKLETGKYAGKTIGKMTGGGGEYKGTISDPANDRIYSGSINTSRSSLKMQGCALRIFCRTQTWQRL